MPYRYSCNPAFPSALTQINLGEQKTRSTDTYTIVSIDSPDVTSRFVHDCRESLRPCEAGARITSTCSPEVSFPTREYVPSPAMKSVPRCSTCTLLMTPPAVRSDECSRIDAPRCQESHPGTIDDVWDWSWWEGINGHQFQQISLARSDRGCLVKGSHWSGSPTGLVGSFLPLAAAWDDFGTPVCYMYTGGTSMERLTLALILARLHCTAGGMAWTTVIASLLEEKTQHRIVRQRLLPLRPQLPTIE